MANKEQLFQEYKENLEIAGLVSSDEKSVICPLCWQGKSIEELSLEHILPDAIGGTAQILTCTKCNNEHGSKLDSHLANFQSVRDAFKGQTPFSADLVINDRKVHTQLEWKEGAKNFTIIGPASNPKNVEAIHKDFAEGKVSEMELTIFYRYNKHKRDLAVLRAAYLILFRCHGYMYAKEEVAQQIRKRIADPSITEPPLSPLITALPSFPVNFDNQHYVTEGKLNDVNFFLVIIRIRKETTSHLAAFVPAPGPRSGEFFSVMEKFSMEQERGTFNIPISSLYT